MKRRLLTLLIVSTLCLLSAGTGAEEPKRVMNFIAVLDLQCGEGVDKKLATPLTNIIIQEIVATGKYTVIDRANRDKILNEVGFQQSGCVDESCVVEMGQMLGVGKLVIGTIDLLGSTYLINLQLINVQTGAVEIAVSEKCKCDLDGLIDAVSSAARKLMGQSLIPQPQPPLKPKGPPPPKPEEIKFIPATPEQQASCGADMVYVPTGWFMMGCNTAKDSQCLESENPYHAIYLDAYCMDKYEYPNKAGEMPNDKMSWIKAQTFCEEKGKRLPTEAEWEKGARGTHGKLYPWGDNIDVDKVKSVEKKYKSGTHTWNVSPYGIYDMAGNVWEWTADYYSEDYYTYSPSRNPKGPSSGQYRILRGGGWVDGFVNLRASRRVSSYPKGRAGTRGVGFRCAKSP